MERVSRSEVVRHWLRRETEKDGASDATPDPDAISTDAAVAALLREKPGAADVVWETGATDWYRTELSQSRLDRLRLIGGPPRLLWQSLSPDGTVTAAARRVAAEPTATLRAETGVDIDRILKYRDALAAGDTLDPLVLGTRRGCAPCYVADGNHRATALALYRHETGRYDPQPAYLGITPNPVLRPAYERICGAARALGQRLRSLR